MLFHQFFILVAVVAREFVSRCRPADLGEMIVKEAVEAVVVAVAVEIGTGTF